MADQQRQHTDVHDHGLYFLSIDYLGRRVVLHTVCPEPEYFKDGKFIDVIFHDVLNCHIEKHAFGRDFNNVLFGVDECDPRFLLERDSDLLKKLKNYGWPIHPYSDLDDLVVQIKASGAKAYEIHGSCGACGIVFAGSLEHRPRTSRFEWTG